MALVTHTFPTVRVFIAMIRIPKMRKTLPGASRGDGTPAFSYLPALREILPLYFVGPPLQRPWMVAAPFNRLS